MEKTSNQEKYEIVKFVDNGFELEVNVSPSEDTVWLTQDQMAKLFQKARTTIVEHIKNIYLAGSKDPPGVVFAFDDIDSAPENQDVVNLSCIAITPC